MSVIIACPKCQKNLKVEEHVLGKNIKCPACAAVFASEAPVAAAPAVVPRADEDEEEARPRKAGRKAARDDADEEDRPRRAAGKRRRDEDDEDDRSRRGSRKREKKSSGGTVALILGAVVLLLCGGCGLGGYYVWVKINEGAHEFAAAMTGVQAQLGTNLQTRPAGPRGPAETTKAAPTNTGKAEGPKPPEQPTIVSAEQLVRDLTTDNEAFGRYVRNPLQVEGVVQKHSPSPDNLLREVQFEVPVTDKKTSAKKTVIVYCRFATPLPADKAGAVAVGRKITVRGRLTGWDPKEWTSAQLNECDLVSSEPSKPGREPKPDGQPVVVKAEDFGKDLYEGEREAYSRYFRKPL